jgi:hypothetical protein
MSKSHLIFTFDTAISDELDYLVAQAKSGLSESDKKRSVALLTEVYCGLLDVCYGQLLEKVNAEHSVKSLEEAYKVLKEIEAKSRHYMGWITGFLATEKVVRVIHYFDGLVERPAPGSGDKPVLKLPLDPAIAVPGLVMLKQLLSGEVKDIDKGIELLIKSTDAVIEQLVEEPKRVMKFNLIVDKTLGGVIALLKGIGYAIIRKIGKQLPEPAFGIVAAHLMTFLRTED